MGPGGIEGHCEGIFKCGAKLVLARHMNIPSHKQLRNDVEVRL